MTKSCKFPPNSSSDSACCCCSYHPLRRLFWPRFFRAFPEFFCSLLSVFLLFTGPGRNDLPLFTRRNFASDGFPFFSSHDSTTLTLLNVDSAIQSFFLKPWGPLDFSPFFFSEPFLSRFFFFPDSIIVSGPITRSTVSNGPTLLGFFLFFFPLLQGPGRCLPPSPSSLPAPLDAS